MSNAIAALSTLRLALTVEVVEQDGENVLVVSSGAGDAYLVTHLDDGSQDWLTEDGYPCAEPAWSAGAIALAKAALA